MLRKKFQIITSYPINDEPVIKNRLSPFIKMAINYNYDVQIVSPDEGVFEIDEVLFEHVKWPDHALKPRGFAKRTWFEIRQARRLINAAMQYEADYRMITVPSMFLLFNMYLFKRSPIIVDIRDITWDYLSEKNVVSFMAKKLFKILARVNLKSTLCVNVTNQTEQCYLTEVLGLKDTEILLVPNGVAQFQFAELSKVTLDMKTRLSVAYIGNVGIAQNLRYLVDAAEKLPNVIFYIVGDGTDYKSLVKYAEGKHVPNLTMSGRLGWDEIKEIYFRAHVLYAQLMPDFDMAMPSKLYEYLSTGKFIIYGGQRHAKSSLANFDNNKVIDSCDSVSLESTILKLLDSKEYLSLSSRNKNAIEKDFIREKSVARFFEHMKSYH